MKQILTTLLLLFSLTLSAQTVDVVGPKKKPKTAAPAKPKQQTKPATPAAKPQTKPTPKTNSKPQPKQPSISSPTGYENGHGYVDLGLSVKWATMNVGASTPTDYGDYYAWGETRTKNNYGDNYFDAVKGGLVGYIVGYNKYEINKKTTLDLSDDAAHANWGGSWRMPTRAEQDELCNSCKWTWTTINGVNGYCVFSNRNGNSIFIPAAGYWPTDNKLFVGSGGYYSSSSLDNTSSSLAFTLSFFSQQVSPHSSCRTHGWSVRAVCK